MSDTTPIATTIQDQAAQPSSTSVDGTTVSNRPLSELIAAEQSVAGKAALSRRGFGLQVRKMRRGSALG